MARQDFFAEGQFLGSRTIPHLWSPPETPPLISPSVAYYCHKCGEIWGRIRHELPGEGWFLRYALCREHGDGRFIPLSSSPTDPTIFQDNWPSGAIHWEFESALRLAEKEVNHVN